MFTTLANTTTAALFLIRVTAIYSQDRWISAFFVASWVVVLGLYIYDDTLAALAFAEHPESQRCIEGPGHGALGSLANAIFDTLVYLAISWRITSYSVAGDNWKDRLRSFTRGDGLLGLSKSLLYSGQIYYL